MIGIDSAAREAARYYIECRKLCSRLLEMEDSDEMRAFVGQFEAGREIIKEREEDEKALEEAVQEEMQG